MSLHDELLFQACCIHCHNLARKYCKNTRTILCAANISKNNLQHNKKCPQEKTEMFQSSLIITMGLGAINSTVSEGKCVLIMQMSKFKLGTVEKNRHQLQVLREEPNLCFCDPCVPGNSPYLTLKFARTKFPTKFTPPPFLIIKTWILNLDKVCNAM